MQPGVVSSGGGGEGVLLGLEELVNALFSVVEHFVELVAAVGVLLGGGLGLGDAVEDDVFDQRFPGAEPSGPDR